ncbi:hypothetical protein TYRP_015065 [Tyrophagus putrescentiae]|nr:hypothetical protein TYRP_015065 [Tyrophagus putrescentiae]
MLLYGGSGGKSPGDQAACRAPAHHDEVILRVDGSPLEGAVVLQLPLKGQNGHFVLNVVDTENQKKGKKRKQQQKKKVKEEEEEKNILPVEFEDSRIL